MSPKQQRFVQEYLIDLNATQAAIRAGYSAKTANEQGSRLLANASIREAVARGQEKVAAKAELTVEAHLDELEKIRNAALEAKQFAAATTAEVARGKVAGFYIDRTEDVTNLSRDERKQRLLKLIA